ncbi:MULTISPECIES: zinc ribbon domain-containing protein [Bacillaceae]|uniref:Zinc-ribbon domain-containing protein n=1 Tax=Evansella alkalicola TaxID=745819 RepID=A0ABS6JQQ6_9BACI|nr:MULTISPECIES: zinc ribbon domain-containing protein [Bacillaceae]MBU9720883.1 zinc-ribbon domain-containing protein [Bacillus alkalicola]
MALRPCPECGHSVSNKAESCPNCGYPFIVKQDFSEPISEYEEGSGLTFWGVVGAVIVAVIILSIF